MLKLSVRVIALSVLFISLLLLLPWAAAAQTESGAASVAGRVVDASGSPVAGAPIVVTNTATGYSRKVTSNADGRFVALAMPVGTYVVEATSAGQTAKKTTLLRVGSADEMTLVLGVRMAEEVTVSGAVTSLDASDPAISTTIPTKAIADLPVRGRNFTEFAQLTPGIVQESDRSGMVISGQRSINSNVALDGADFNDPLQGNQRGGNESIFFFPQSAVSQFQVVRTGATAEVGRTSAGFVNVVTKSGTNTRHGDVFYSNRNKQLTSKDAFNRKLNNQQNQFGGSTGGALTRDKAFYFLAAEQSFLRVPFVVKFQQQAANIIVPDELNALEGEKRGTNNPTSVFVRTDYTLTPAQSLNIQYTFSHLSGKNFNFDSPQQDVAESANYTRKNTSHGVKGSWLSVFGGAVVNEARGQVANDDRTEGPNVDLPQIVITGFGTLGGDTGRPRLFNNTRFQFTDNLTVVNGRHQIRVGVDINITKSQQERESNTLGRFDYTSLTNYKNGVISRYRQTVAGFDPADLRYDATQKEAGVFIQDKITVNRATVALGLRWDGQWNPVPPRPNPAFAVTSKIPNDLKMVQPRVGVTWKATDDGRTVIRTSAGVYAARTPANLFQRVFTDNGYSTVAVDSRTDASILALVSPTKPLATLPAGTKIPAQRIFGFDPDFRNPRTLQAAGSIDRELARGVTVSLGYIVAHATHLQRRLDRNLGAPSYDAVGQPIYPSARPNTTIAQLEVNESTARSNYQAFTFSGAAHRGRVYTMVNYTYALNKDDDSNERNFSREPTLNVYNTAAEYTWSKQDIRHSVNVSSTLDLKGGFTLGAIMLARTGMPYTAVIGSDQQRDGNDDNDRAVINGFVSERNAFRQPNFFNLDLRLQKALRIGAGRSIDLMVDVFNVTRASNKHFGNDAVSVYGTTANPVATAGQPLFAPSTARFGGPRQVQLSGRVRF